MFTPEQIAAMQAPLDAERVAHRSQAGKQLSYVETWDAMEAANRIWGYDGWCYTLDRLEQQAGVWLAIVTVTVYAGLDRVVTRQDAGAAIPAAKRGETPSPEATETAIKGAVSDATKRALRSFGSQWGLNLYDKDAPPVQQQAQQPARTVDQQTGEITETAGPLLNRERVAALNKYIYDTAHQQGYTDDVAIQRWVIATIKAKWQAETLDKLTVSQGRALMELAKQVDFSAAQPKQAAR